MTNFLLELHKIKFNKLVNNISLKIDKIIHFKLIFIMIKILN